MMRFIGLVVVAVIVAACGFRPLHENRGFDRAPTALDQVWINTIPNAEGLMLRNALVDRFYTQGYPENPRYRLAVGLLVDVRDLALEKDDTITRAQIIIRADYTVVESATNRIIEQNSIRAIGAYNILPGQYTTSVSYADARRRAIDEIAEKITLRLATRLSREP